MRISPREIPRLIRELRSLPEVTIRMFGDYSSEAIYRKFTSRHPRFKLIQSKRWGVALLSLPDRFEEYLQGKPKQVVRTSRNRCLRNGFGFAPIQPLERLEEILAINLSLPERQGQAMGRSYLEIDALRAHFQRPRDVYGVLDSAGRLKAYADVPVVGEVAILNRLLGHGEELAKGVMYLCVSEVIRAMVQQKAERGVPLWLLYDTFFGSSSGLRYFKEHLGFKPYKVRWVWSS